MHHRPRRCWFVLACAWALLTPIEVRSSTSNAVTTVPHVDLTRYVGLWHQLALIPNRFQDQCVSGTTATYALREDGRIDVLNRCTDAKGRIDEAKGLARVIDRSTNAKLEVSFVSFLGWRPFWGDYWVIGLDEEYAWAVIGTPDRKYGWVLARAPELDTASWQEIMEVLEANGYAWEDFEHSP